MHLRICGVFWYAKMSAMQYSKKREKMKNNILKVTLLLTCGFCMPEVLAKGGGRKYVPGEFPAAMRETAEQFADQAGLIPGGPERKKFVDDFVDAGMKRHSYQRLAPDEETQKALGEARKQQIERLEAEKKAAEEPAPEETESEQKEKAESEAPPVESSGAEQPSVESSSAVQSSVGSSSDNG